MFTVLKTKNGDLLNFVTQQYEIGTYIIINNDPSMQGGTLLKEVDYHKKLRRNAIKSGDIIEDGTFILFNKDKDLKLYNPKQKENEEGIS